MTKRQAQILYAIVEHYIKTASPVGSAALAEHFDVSSATIRSEMAALEDQGFIDQPHTSAGRTPTDEGYRHYVDELPADLEQSPVADRIQKVVNRRVKNAGEATQAIRSAVDSLVEITNNIGLASAGSQLYYSGLTSLLRQPEFDNIRRARAVASLIDNLEPWLREATLRDPVNIYIGSENPIGKTSDCTLIVAGFTSPLSDQSYIGVIGPTRQSYQEVIHLVRFTSNTLEEAINE